MQAIEHDSHEYWCDYDYGRPCGFAGPGYGEGRRCVDCGRPECYGFQLTDFLVRCTYCERRNREG